MNLVVRRISAFCIDYVLIIVLGGLIYLMTLVFGIQDLSPIQAQLLGFFTLTLPVFLYFYLTESSKYKSSLGKRLLKLRISSNPKSKTTSIFRRNLFKFLPWEIAHTGVHWVFYYSSQHMDIPIWVWILLIVPQFTMALYMISILFTHGKSSVYDRIGGTQIIHI